MGSKNAVIEFKKKRKKVKLTKANNEIKKFMSLEIYVG
jgi:hypothetical protein